MVSRSIALACLLVASVWLVKPVRSADYGSLLAHLPKSVNAVALVDAESIFASEYGKQRNWRGEYAKRFDASPSMLPPTTEEFVWGAELNLNYLSPEKQYAVMNLSRDLSLPQLAAWLGGTLGEVDGLEAVATPGGGMVVKFSPVQYGMLIPANRQKVARLIRETQGDDALRLSPYLQSVVTDASRTTAHFCQAFDLTDAVDRKAVRAAIGNSAVVESQGLDTDQVADLLAGIRGVNMLVTFTEKANAKMIIDFSSDTGVLRNSALALVLEVLSEAGASFNELPDWTAATDGTRITLEGPLGESGLMRLFSFLEVDTTVVDGAAHKESASGTQTDASDDDRYANDPATITRDYYQSVQKYLNDLSHERGAKSYYSIAVWYDKYAGRIERLPILNVDSAVLDYSESVIGHLRAAADSIQAGGVRTAARGKQITASDSGYYLDRADRGYGYRMFSGGANYAASQVADVEAGRRAIRAQEQAQSTLDAKGHLAAIEEDTLRIRREMTEKYGIEF